MIERSNPKSVGKADQLEIWGFENLSATLDNRKEDYNLQEVLEFARSIKTVTPKQLSELAMKLSKRYEIDLQKIEEQLGIDPLTGAFNRGAYDEKFSALVKRLDYENGASHSIMAIVCDIDYFHEFNRTYGLQRGDDALRKTVENLRKIIKEGDVIVRYGGDEFVIIITFPIRRDEKGKIIEPDHEARFQTIQKQANANLSVLVDGMPVSFQVSMGHAVLKKSEYEKAKHKGKYEKTPAYQQLFAQADQELSTFKKSRKTQRL